MAKARVSINPMYEGGAGGFSFYTRDGEQIVRQRKNNSNYGETASRTHAQMVRRVKWANLVNVFKAMKTWQPSAYEYKAKGQTDYNIFMSLNINSAAAALTKDQANNGCAVMDAYQVSRGSLPPITTAWNGSRDEWKTDIVITAAITATTTVGALSSDIIANNPQFANGDNIAIVAFSQFVDSRQYPYVVSVYNELTLDKDSNVLLNTLPVWNWLSTADSQFLAISQPGSSFGAYSHAAAIHTRKADSLMVSTQNLVASPASVVANYSGDEWVDECIDTYGLDADVPLNPSFKGGTITQVTANGSQISEGDVLTGSQFIRIYGGNLGVDNLHVSVDDVEIGVMRSYNGFVEFLCQLNGSLVITLNGGTFMTLVIQGVVIPSLLPAEMRANQADVTAVAPGAGHFINPVSVRDINYLLYPRVVDTDFMYYTFRVFGDEWDSNEFTLVNATMNSQDVSGSFNRFNFSVTDTDSIAYLMYEGYVLFVFNYVA